MQTAPQLAARALRLAERGIELLNPVFDLDFGQEAMASAMLGLGKQLGIPKLRCLPALMAGAQAVRRHTAAAVSYTHLSASGSLFLWWLRNPTASSTEPM